MSNRRQSQSGFTLVEVMIALTISALLMAAVATSFYASLLNYQENQDIYESVSRARQSLMRVTTQLRTANYVDATTGVNQCDFFDPCDNYYLFDYRSGDSKLVLVDGANNEFDLCDNVSAMEFQKQVSPSDPNRALSVRISMTVDCGNTSQDLASAVVVRKAMTN